MLRTSDVPNMNVLPDFSILARRAFKDFASQLEGFTLRNQWVKAYSSIAWMSMLVKSTPAVTPPGQLLPQHLLDSQFPIWRIWSSWKPNKERIKMLDGLDSAKRGVLPDMLALEGPDFISGNQATLRDGLMSQYGAAKHLVRFRSLVIEVTSSKKDELKEILNRTASALETAIVKGDGAFELFVQLTIARPITQETLQVLQAVERIQDTPKFHVHNAVREIWLARPKITGRHISALSHVICALDDVNGEALRKVFLRPWFIQGIERCIRECQMAVRTHIDTGLRWGHLALEFHTFCKVVKDSVNCLPLLDALIQRQLDILPAADMLRTLLEVYDAAGGEKTLNTTAGGNALKNAIEAFCIDRLMVHGSLTHASRQTVDAILEVWKNTKATARHRLAIEVSKLAADDFILGCRCLTQITQLPDEFVHDLIYIIDGLATSPEVSCIKFTKILARIDNADVVQCWKGILYSMINAVSDKILDHSLNLFKASEWCQFMLDLNALFAEIIMNMKLSPPPILQQSIHLWLQQLSEYIPAITRLEECLGEGTSAVQCILKGGEGLWVENLVQILEALSWAQGQPVEKLMQSIVGMLSKEGKNASEIAECVPSLLAMTEEGLEACQRIWDSNHDKSVPVVVKEIAIIGWLQDEDMSDTDKAAIKALACLFGLQTYEHGVTDDMLMRVAKHYEKQELEILSEMDRLEGIQRALKARDPRGTAILLEQLGVKDFSPLDEELEALPPAIADAVEKHGENEVEMSFPLSSFTELERSAIGVGSAKNLLVRLFLDYTSDMPPAFCIHLDNDSDISGLETEHTPWVCFQASSEPQWPYCRGRDTPITWQLSRVLHRHMKLIDEVGIAGMHDLIRTRLDQHAHNCIVCGTTQNTAGWVHLRRSTPCPNSNCSRIWNNMPLELRVPEIRVDPFVVDMLLTGVYAAANSGRMELLPGCPIRTTQNVIGILNSLPPLAGLGHTTDLAKSLKSYHKDAEQLVTWACTHFRGFITSASGICRLPGFPVGTHQFVLANANPLLESGFTTKLPRSSPQTRVLFHGTSLDRLPSILAQGLKIQSGTSLQRTGAAHGRGIYMAEEPATSFSYSPSAVSWRGSGLSNMRLLLGCEVVGNGSPVSPGIHVIRDEKMVMVRYVFLFTNSAYAPNANHVTPAMLSAMNALRSGSV